MANCKICGRPVVAGPVMHSECLEQLVTEAAVGILMRMIPQINVFSVNFQIKIIVGLLTLLILFSPMSDRIYQIFDNMFAFMDTLLLLLTT